ncbi:MAG: putative lipid II flippase FtsW [Pyrinomonadaceae bacterium]
MGKKLQFDWILFATIAALSLFGVVMVYSASAMVALKETDGASQYGYVFKQFAFTVAGLLVMLAATRFDYRWLRQDWLVAGLVLVTIFLLIAVLCFSPVNGARRWIKIAGFSFQSSELAKPVLALFLAFLFAKRNASEMLDLKFTFLPSAFVVGMLLLLIMAEPDLGTALVLAISFAVVYFAAGANWRHFAITGIVALVGLAGALLLVPWRMKRILAFLNPWSAENVQGAGYQLVQSLMAVGSGGITGVGFANSQQKIYYLPFAHSDFIFAIIGEELGLVGALAVVAMFGVILWRGTRTALAAPDRFGRLLAIGLTTNIVVQAFFNISVVIGLLPTKGIPLPFISYGGSSVMVTLLSAGLLLNISQYAGTYDLTDEK